MCRRRPLALIHRDGEYGPAHAGFNDRLRDTFGTASYNSPDVFTCKTNRALAAVDALLPRDELEAMLAQQMVGADRISPAGPIT
jgi:hypothetical protein